MEPIKSPNIKAETIKVKLYEEEPMNKLKTLNQTTSRHKAEKPPKKTMREAFFSLLLNFKKEFSSFYFFSKYLFIKNTKIPAKISKNPAKNKLTFIPKLGKRKNPPIRAPKEAPIKFKP